MQGWDSFPEYTDGYVRMAIGNQESRPKKLTFVMDMSTKGGGGGGGKTLVR